MRIFLTPLYIVSLCLSLVNGAQFADDQSSEDGFVLQRGDTDMFSFDDDEDEVGMGERTDSVSFYVESRLDPSAAETENGALDLLRKLEETERMKTIRSLSFKGVGAFPAQYAGGVIPTKRSDESLLREASKNSLAAVKLIGDTVALAIPNVSKPGDSRDSSGGSTPRPSYMKQTGVASIN